MRKDKCGHFGSNSALPCNGRQRIKVASACTDVVAQSSDLIMLEKPDLLDILLSMSVLQSMRPNEVVVAH